MLHTCLICVYLLDTHIASFQRQLNLYGFKCINRGNDKGSFYHSQFQRGNWEEAKKILRTAHIPKKSIVPVENADEDTHTSATAHTTEDRIASQPIKQCVPALQSDKSVVVASTLLKSDSQHIPSIVSINNKVMIADTWFEDCLTPLDSELFGNNTCSLIDHSVSAPLTSRQPIAQDTNVRTSSLHATNVRINPNLDLNFDVNVFQDDDCYDVPLRVTTSLGEPVKINPSCYITAPSNSRNNKPQMVDACVNTDITQSNDTINTLIRTCLPSFKSF